MDDSFWPWMSCQPGNFHLLSNSEWLFVVHSLHLKPSSCWTDHSHTSWNFLFLLVTLCNLVRTNQVYAQLLPWVASSFLFWSLAVSLVCPSVLLTCFAFRTNVVDCGPCTLPHGMLLDCFFCSDLAKMTQHGVIPLCQSCLEHLGNYHLVVATDQGVFLPAPMERLQPMIVLTQQILYRLISFLCFLHKFVLHGGCISWKVIIVKTNSLSHGLFSAL